MKKTNSYKKVVRLGVLSDEGYEINQRVYYRGGCSIAFNLTNAKVKVVRKYDKKNHCDVSS